MTHGCQVEQGPLVTKLQNSPSEAKDEGRSRAGCSFVIDTPSRGAGGKGLRVTPARGGQTTSLKKGP